MFLIMSDTDDSFNFLISMCYTQLFNLLCEKADDVYGGRLPVHVRCLIDEVANIGQIPRLEKLVATIRSREISALPGAASTVPAQSYLKDNADTIIGNMDTSIFWRQRADNPQGAGRRAGQGDPSTPTTPARAGAARHPFSLTTKSSAKSL